MVICQHQSQHAGWLTAQRCLQVGHSSYIGAVACRVKASEQSGKVVTGWGLCQPILPHQRLHSSPAAAAACAGSLDKTAKVWDAPSGAELFHLQGHQYQVTAVAFGSGSDVVTASADGYGPLVHQLAMLLWLSIRDLYHGQLCPLQMYH